MRTVVFAVGRALSQTINYRDSLHLTLSAKTHMEARGDSPDWARLERWIDRCLGKGHCKECWDSEVARARMILEIENGLEPWNVS